MSEGTMQLTLIEGNAGTFRAGYSCPCGCTPSVEYVRGADPVEEGCCCGNHFAVGPRAAASLTPTLGFRPELQTFDAPWGEPLEAAWLVGPSVHGPASEQDHHAASDGDTHQHDMAVDPVCGMTVEPESARARGLHSTRAGTDYFFCGKGCKLEFDEDPGHYLDPSHARSA